MFSGKAFTAIAGSIQAAEPDEPTAYLSVGMANPAQTGGTIIRDGGVTGDASVSDDDGPRITHG